MSRIQFLRLATLLPVAVPVALYVAVFALKAFGSAVPEFVGFAAAMSFSAIFFFGVPYFVLVAIALFLLRHKSWETHVRAALAAPWLMVIAAEVFAFATDPSHTSGSDVMVGGLVIAFFCLVIGYAYVAVALATVHVLTRSGRLRPAG